MYYVHDDSTIINPTHTPHYATHEEAIARARELRAYWLGKGKDWHFNVTKVETLWTTKTLADRKARVAA